MYELGRGSCTGSLLLAARWAPHFLNFDHIGKSMLSLFVLNTLVGWPAQFYTWVDAGADGPTRRGEVGLYLVLLVTIVFVCRYLLFGMVSGSLFLNSRLALREIQRESLPQEMQTWLLFQRRILASRPKLVQYIRM